MPNTASRTSDMPAAMAAHPHAMVHVDLDGASAIYGAHGLLYGGASDTLFTTGLTNGLQLLSDVGIPATLFVIADDLRDPEKRGLIEQAVRAGHEIGSHSTTHARYSVLSTPEKRREVLDSRKQIEDALGVEVAGFRAPMFDVDDTLYDLLTEGGYRYDSSIFPTSEFARRLGIASVEERPFMPRPDHDVLELPLPFYAPLPVPFHPSYSLVLGTWYFRLGLQRHRRRRAPMVLLFHLTDFAEPLPRSELPGNTIRFFTLSHRNARSKIASCRTMLEHVRRAYEVIPTTQFVEGFLPRERTRARGGSHVNELS